MPKNIQLTDEEYAELQWMIEFQQWSLRNSLTYKYLPHVVEQQKKDLALVNRLMSKFGCTPKEVEREKKQEQKSEKSPEAASFAERHPEYFHAV